MELEDKGDRGEVSFLLNKTGNVSFQEDKREFSSKPSNSLIINLNKLNSDYIQWITYIHTYIYIYNFYKASFVCQSVKYYSEYFKEI